MTKQDFHFSVLRIEPDPQVLAPARTELPVAIDTSDVRMEICLQDAVTSSRWRSERVQATTGFTIAPGSAHGPNALTRTIGSSSMPGCHLMPHTESPAFGPPPHSALQPANSAGKYFLYSLADPDEAPFFMRMASNWTHILNMQARTAGGSRDIRAEGLAMLR